MKERHLVATMPLYLNALTGSGAHLVTVNTYLAQRDAEWMGAVFGFLGLTVAVIDKFDPGSPERQAAYAADITYGTNNEFGFDYLRDNMVHQLAQKVQREYSYAIIDEIDSILIDEARTPSHYLRSGWARYLDTLQAVQSTRIRALQKATAADQRARK